KVYGVAVPRRSALARIVWKDDRGRPVLADPPDAGPGHVPRAEPEYPTDKDTSADGWTEVSGTYRAPAKATRAIVEFHLRWARGGRIDWAEVGLTEALAPPLRKARLAAVHFIPRGGKVPMDNC